MERFQMEKSSGRLGHKKGSTSENKHKRDDDVCPAFPIIFITFLIRTLLKKNNDKIIILNHSSIYILYIASLV